MRYMLDTDTCIYIIKKKPNEVIERFKKYDIEEICISSITYSELMYGVRKSQQSVKNYISLIQRFLKINYKLIKILFILSLLLSAICFNVKVLFIPFYSFSTFPL